jgi:hypothetical protein
MRLEEYWGVGPKTSERLVEALGHDEAVEAIESANSRALVEAGLSRGRATQILRRASGGEAMDVLATRDTRAVYKELLDLVGEYAVTRGAADRIRVLTPLETRGEMERRLDDVLLAAESWADLDDETQRTVLSAFDDYDGDGDTAGGGDAAAVEVALELREQGVTDGVFAPLADLDADAVADAAEALSAMEGVRASKASAGSSDARSGSDGGEIREGYDDDLDRLRDAAVAVEGLEGTAAEVVDAVQSGGVRGTDEFREGVVEHVARETGVGTGRVREAAATDALDATDFVASTLRELRTDLRAAADEREADLVAELEADVGDARDDVDAAVAAVEDIAFYVSLARFALDHDCTPPEFVEDRDAVAVVNARNLTLTAAEGAVQPVTYGIGDHDVTGPPVGDQVAVLTGANSGGKTTLLETLCQVALLAQMGLPVPADHAEVGAVDAVVFHRRHASFNAGVLEATLHTIVPPLTEDGRTLMLVDEFEAITEPGSAADLLHGLVTLTVDRDALGVFVTHLADDLEPLPDPARTDGIFAQGLSPDLELEVDYQPQFDTVGRSTPEFIVSRLLAEADPDDRDGFQVLAEAMGQEAVQRTLADARWTGS